jgi:ketosteroid isomerase-like protein
VTPAESNLDAVQHWYARTLGEYSQGSGLEAALERIPEIFDPEVEFSPWLAREVEQRTYHGHDGLRTFFRELNDMLGEVRYGPTKMHPLSDHVIVVFTRLEWTGRGSEVPVCQDLGIVHEFRDGLVTRMTAFGSHDEAIRAAEEVAHA